MKKILLLGVLLFMAAPAMAAANVDITCVVDGNEVTVSYETDGNNIRAFGLDINVVSGDAVITKMEMVSTDYRIFPGQIVIEDGDVTDWGTPYAADDLGDAVLTVEMGSLYAADDPCKQDPPPTSGDLFKFWVTCGSATSHFAITENTLRGGVVMEDPDEEPVVTLCDDDICEGGCTVPDVAGMTEAAACAAIADANFTGDCLTIEECNDVVADGLALRTDPIAGSEIPCDSNVTVVLSNNPALPGAATLTSPAANATCVAPSPTLTWTVGAGTDTQDVRFGTTNPPPVVAAGVAAGTTTYPVATTNYTKYYWTVDEKNECGEVTAGTVQCFLSGPNAGKPCCQNEVAPHETCLGNINHDSYVRSTDIGSLTTFVTNIGPPTYRCTTVAASDACPPCFDINGDGYVRSTDIGALTTLITGFGPPSYRKTCPWLTCP
jgi:hypothetical protein